MKKILLLSLLFPCFSYAQTFTCQNKPINIKVNFVETPLKYNHDYRSKDLKSITTRQDSTDIDSFVIGRYNPEWTVQIGGKTITESAVINNKIHTCSYLSEITANIQLNSTIYISQEALKFNCTFRRVLSHETLHYNIEKNLFQVIKQQSPQILKKHFDKNPASFNNNFNLNTYFSNTSAKAQAEILDIRKHLAEPYHNQIDTKENYTYESNICGPQERSLLASEIRK